MPERVRLVSRIVASVRGLVPKNWFGHAGQRFTQTTDAISDFAKEHRLTPLDVIEDGVELGRRKIEGLANNEYSAALKNFAEAEQKKIEAEFARRALETKLMREEVQLDKDRAEARIANVRAMEAELELVQKLKQVGVVLYKDNVGSLNVVPSTTVDLLAFVARRQPDNLNIDKDHP